VANNPNTSSATPMARIMPAGETVYQTA